MVSRTKKTIAVTAAVVGTCVAIAAGVASSCTPALQERWYLWKLQSEDESEWKRAAEKLGALRSARAVPRLVMILRDVVEPEPDPSAVVFPGSSVLLPGRFAPPVPTTHYAAQALQKIGPAAVPGLIEALSAGDGRVRRIVETLLPTLLPITSAEVPALIELLSHESADVRMRAVNALGESGSIASAAIPSLIRMLEEADALSEVARHALPAMGPASGPGVPPLIDVLEDRTRRTVAREYAAAALVDQRASTALQRVVSDPRDDPGVRRAAVWSLGKLSGRTEATARALAVALGSENRDLRFAAVRALYHLGPAAKVAVPELRRALEDEGYFIARLARLTLESLGEDTGKAPSGPSSSDMGLKFVQ